MKIGLTYDLREEYLAQGYGLEETAEFDSIETIEAFETGLKKLGFTVERIGNIYQLVNRLATGKRWDLVFNIAEGMHGLGREAQVPALLEAYQIPYTFSDSVTLALTLDKSLAKRVTRDQSIPTAAFIVVDELAKLELVNATLPFPLFAKPIAEGTGKGINAASLLTTPEQLQSVCKDLLQRFQQPVLVESYLPGREFTVGIIGTGADAQIFGVMEISLRDNAEQGAYSFANKEQYEDRIEYYLAHDAEAKQAGVVALAAWRALGCRDAGRVDVRSNAMAEPQFLEVNPIAGLHPTRSDLVIMAQLMGLTYQDLLQRIMQAVTNRLAINSPALESP